MTVHKSLKRRVRARMAKTGERYATARRHVVATPASDPVATPAASPGLGEIPEPTASSTESPLPSDAPSAASFRGNKASSDEALTARTGRRWAEWFGLLEAWGAADRPHPEIARWLIAEHGLDGWWSQELTVRYEMAIGRREPGQRPDGFTISASKTVAAPVERLFAAFVDVELRARWLPDATLRLRVATPDRTARFDWQDGASRLAIGFTAKGDTRSMVALEHSRLPDPETRDRMKAFWRERLHELQGVLES